MTPRRTETMARGEESPSRVRLWGVCDLRIRIFFREGTGLLKAIVAAKLEDSEGLNAGKPIKI